MTARAWFQHAGQGGGPAIRGSSARKGEARFVGPEDKDRALPIPQVAPAARHERRKRAERTPPGDGSPAPEPREEYPGPQTSSTGEHVDPGQTRPSRRRSR